MSRNVHMSHKWGKRVFENMITYTPPDKSGVEYVVFTGSGGPEPFHVSWARRGVTTLHHLGHEATLSAAFRFIRMMHSRLYSDS